MLHGFNKRLEQGPSWQVMPRKQSDYATCALAGCGKRLEKRKVVLVTSTSAFVLFCLFVCLFGCFNVADKVPAPAAC